jgi:hypothetical protein
VARALAHGEHVVGRRADVLGRAVEAVHAFDGVAEVEEGGAAAIGVERRAGRQADDGLAAARVQARRGVLEGHRGGQAQGIADASLQCG